MTDKKADTTRRYSDDAKDRDAHQLRTFKLQVGEMRNNAKEVLKRVVNDPAITVEQMRVLAMHAGATLDCFFSIDKDHHRAYPIEDKAIIVKQLGKNDAGVRLNAAQRMGKEERTRRKQVADTQKTAHTKKSTTSPTKPTKTKSSQDKKRTRKQKTRAGGGGTDNKQNGAGWLGLDWDTESEDDKEKRKADAAAAEQKRRADAAAAQRAKEEAQAEAEEARQQEAQSGQTMQQLGAAGNQAMSQMMSGGSFQDTAMQTLQTYLPDLIETVVPGGGVPIAGIVMIGLTAVLKGVFGIESGKGGRENVGQRARGQNVGNGNVSAAPTMNQSVQNNEINSDDYYEAYKTYLDSTKIKKEFNTFLTSREMALNTIKNSNINPVNIIQKKKILNDIDIFNNDSDLNILSSKLKSSIENIRKFIEEYKEKAQIKEQQIKKEKEKLIEKQNWFPSLHSSSSFNFNQTKWEFLEENLKEKRTELLKNKNNDNLSAAYKAQIEIDLERIDNIIKQQQLSTGWFGNYSKTIKDIFSDAEEKTEKAQNEARKNYLEQDIGASDIFNPGRALFKFFNGNNNEDKSAPAAPENTAESHFWSHYGIKLINYAVGAVILFGLGSALIPSEKQESSSTGDESSEDQPANDTSDDDNAARNTPLLPPPPATKRRAPWTPKTIRRAGVFAKKNPLFTTSFCFAALAILWQMYHQYARYGKNKQMAALLSSFEPRPDKVDSDRCTYADTGYVLKHVDPDLHQMFKRYETTHSSTRDPLDKVFYHVVTTQLRQRRTSLSVHREVMNEHLIRSDGTIRESVGEVARAVKHYAKVTNVVGRSWAYVKGLLGKGTHRARSSRRSSSSSKTAKKRTV